MPENIEWIFFDIGSTLVDEMECYKKRYSEAIENTDITYEEFAAKVIEFSKQNKKGDHEAVQFYNLDLPEWHKELEILYADTKSVLSTLYNKGYKLGIIANQLLGTQSRLEKWQILQYFDVVVSSAEEGIAKPDLQIFRTALQKADCKPHNAAMAGDRLDNDIVPANKVGLKTIWVKQGFAVYSNPQDELEYADYTVNSLTEICDIL